SATSATVSQPRAHSHHYSSTHPQHRRHRRKLSHCLLFGLLFVSQTFVASGMLDALKALFILTGASTYLGRQQKTWNIPSTSLPNLHPFTCPLFILQQKRAKHVAPNCHRGSFLLFAKLEPKWNRNGTKIWNQIGTKLEPVPESLLRRWEKERKQFYRF